MDKYNMNNTEDITVIDKLETKNTFDPKAYLFTKNHISEDISFIGKEEGGEKTVFNVEKPIFFHPKSKVSFKNISFKLKESLSPFSFIANENMEFINCDFYSFKTCLFPLFSCTSNANITFKNCHFASVLYLLCANDNSNITFENCKFDIVQHNYIHMNNNSSLVMKKCKGNLINGEFLNMNDNSSAYIESSKFKGEYFDSNEIDFVTFEEVEENIQFDDVLHEGEDLKHIMENAPQIVDVCVLHGESSLKIYKSDIIDVSHAFMLKDKSKANILECKTQDTVEALYLGGDSEANIYSSLLKKTSAIFTILENNATVSIYDSTLEKCDMRAIVGVDNTHINVYDSTFRKIDSNGIIVAGNCDVKINGSTFEDSDGTGLLASDNTTVSCTNTKFKDNKLFSVLLFDNSESSFEKCEFRFTKGKKEEGVTLCHVGIQDCAKTYFEQDKFYGVDHIFGGVKAKYSSDVFMKGCYFEDLDIIAILEDESKVYVKESDYKNIGQNIAVFQDAADFGFVSCEPRR